MPILPQAFSDRMQQQLGGQYQAFVDALATAAPVSLRANPLKMQKPLSLPRVPWATEGYYLPQRPLFTLDPWLHGGAYYVQEASSMFLEQALRQSLNLEEPLTVLDLCGAPGGKTTQIASVLSADSLLVSNEVIRSRANILAENVQKWGSGNVVVTNNDPRDFQQLPGFFDAMVVDAPCSGEGMFRKEPNAVEEWSEANVKLCADRQKRILMDVWDALKPGGLLIYSTCTFSPEENELNLTWLSEQQDIEPVRLQLDPQWQITEEPVGDFVGYRFYPHKVQGEGFFMTVVRKVAGLNMNSLRKPKKPVLTAAPKADKAVVAEWLQEPELWEVVKHRETLVALPADKSLEAEAVYQKLRVVYGGIELAEIKKKDFNPMPALALSAHLNKDAFAVAELTLEEALRYLHKDDVALPDAPAGWVLVQYQGVPLGWAKKINQRVNNYFPKEWRIRMNIPEITEDIYGIISFQNVQ